MKKIIPISFLLLLFISQVGYYFIYGFQQRNIKEDVKEQLMAGLPETSLQAIEKSTVTEWQEEGKEFLLKGELYDVVKTKQVDGKIILYCLNDKKEQQLLQDLAKAIKSGNDNNNEKGSKHTVKFQLTDYTAHNIPEITFPGHPACKQFFCYDDALLSALKEITAPPPRV